MELQYPPSMERVTKEIESYLKKNKGLDQVFEVYKRVLAVQLDFLDRIKIELDLTKEELQDCFREGRYLFHEHKPEIDIKLFQDILVSLCKAIKETASGVAESILQLPEAEEFKEDNLKEFLHKISLYNKRELEDLITKEEMDKKTQLDSEIIAFVIFMSLSPFYTCYMKEVKEQVGFSLWRNSYCPICGQTAVRAKHRSEDGARVLDCWLCHAQWVFPRLECPYCNNKDQAKLRFFYVPGEKARQVHVCDECQKYLKTVDCKILGKDVLLDVEVIFTGYLDVLAEKEGYKLADKAALLI